MPAQLTRMSTGPRSSSVRSTALRAGVETRDVPRDQHHLAAFSREPCLPAPPVVSVRRESDVERRDATPLPNQALADRPAKLADSTCHQCYLVLHPDPSVTVPCRPVPPSLLPHRTRPRTRRARCANPCCVATTAPDTRNSQARMSTEGHQGVSFQPARGSHNAPELADGVRHSVGGAGVPGVPGVPGATPRGRETEVNAAGVWSRGCGAECVKPECGTIGPRANDGGAPRARTASALVVRRLTLSAGCAGRIERVGGGADESVLHLLPQTEVAIGDLPHHLE